MEERAEPSSPLKSPSHRPGSPLGNPLHRPASTQKLLPLSPLRPATPGRINHNHTNNAQTIVVQVPRDQIYSTPPPENALLVSQYKLQQEQQFRDDDKKKNHARRCDGRRAFYFFAIFLVTLTLLVGFLSIYTIVRPESPTFSVNRVQVSGDGATKKTRYSRYKYEVTVKVGPGPSSPILVHEFQSDGSRAVLHHRGLRIATGKVDLPAFSRSVDDRKSSFSFRVEMFSSKDTVVPDDIKNSVEKNRSGSASNGTGLVLLMEIPARLNIGGLESWKMDMRVKCRLRVRFSKRESHLLHQHCKAELWT